MRSCIKWVNWNRFPVPAFSNCQHSKTLEIYLHVSYMYLDTFKTDHVRNVS